MVAQSCQLQFGVLVEQLSAALHSMLAAAADVAAAGGSEEGDHVTTAEVADLVAAAASLEAAMVAASFPAPPACCPTHVGLPLVLPTWVAAHSLLYQGGAGGSRQAAAAVQASRPAPKASLAAFQQALLPCAVRLSAALLPHWPLPEQQQADRLELARAVAAQRHGCSNLRCPDWQGQHRKARLCAGCKTLRFCDAACQADAWRHGGHRLVCKLLAADK